MLIKSLAVIMHGDDPKAPKANAKAKPFDLEDEEYALRLIDNGVAQPHGEAAEKRVAQVRERLARERIRAAQEYADEDDGRDDVPVDQRAREAEEARALAEQHARDQKLVDGAQEVARKTAAGRSGAADEAAKDQEKGKGGKG